MVTEVNTLKKKLAAALNESNLPPVVVQLVLEGLLGEVRALVQMQAAVEAVTPPQEEQKKEAAEDGAV